MDGPSLLLPAGGPAVPLDVAPVDLDAGVLGELASIVLGSAPLGLVLQRLAEIAERAIPGAAAVSVTVVRDRTASSAGFTGPVAAALDERQYEGGFGPCLHAAATTTEVIIADAASSAAFPGLADLAAHHGIGSVVAIGLAVAGPATAALNVYRTGPGHTDLAAMTVTIRTARVFAAYAAVAVSNAAAMDAERSTSAQMGSAMASRAGIEPAKGVLMAQRAITAEAAFAVLATTSQHANVKLAEVAARVVATATAGGDPDPH